jgi:hypothetical protein
MLAGRYNYEATAPRYVAKPQVERELWSLQRVRHKLPTTKFARQFGFTPPVAYDEGIRKTLSWLTFLGYTTSQVRSLNNGAAR